MKALAVKAISSITKGLGKLASYPFIAAISQLHPASASFSALFAIKYANDQENSMKDYIDLLLAKLRTIEDKYIDKDFFDTSDGRRVGANIVRSILRDGRKEKIQAMANLTANLHLKTKLTVDEKELFVTTLDGLNPIQLSILENAVREMRNRTANPHRGFGWELMKTSYGQKGVTEYILLQSIRVLESNGIVNQNTATISEEDKSHFITNFGEQFYDFIADVLKEDSLYLYSVVS